MWQTRKGTRVLNATASALAIIAEVYHDAAEFRVYRDFRVGDTDSPRFDAQDGDHLLIHNVSEDEHPRLVGMAHVLNLITGQSGLIHWDDMAHHVKPYDPELGR